MESEQDCNENRRENRDGLAESYDLILLGTGLVQSILSCVASKQGKRVLHLERNEFYGEDYSCHHLSAHLSHYSICDNHRVAKHHSGLTELQITASRLCEVPQQEVLVQFIDNASSAKGVAQPKATPRPTLCHPACFGYSMERVPAAGLHADVSKIHPSFQGYATHKQLTKARVWLRDRDFNIDTTAKVLYGSCPLVELMVASGVSNYLEFKTFEGLYFWMDQSAGSGKCSDGAVWKVPCSRNDVFNTTMLGALEKRALMKFHQFVADWGRAHAGTEVTSLNETDLAVGRSLYRPQNKQQAFAGYSVEAFVDRPFEDFLDDCKISPKLQRIIIFALCCYVSPPHGSKGCATNSTEDSGRLAPTYLTRQALGDMFLHIDSIGRFGETAFLSPMYGASEVVQAFCRMSAVWGGTFILRRSVTSVSLEEDSCTAGREPTPESAPSAFPVSTRVKSVQDSAGNTIRCGAFVCSAGYWPNVPTRRCAVVSCTSTWLGAVVPLARSIIIIPPASLASVRNPYAVHIIQTDASTCAAPEGAVVLHVSTMLDLDADCAAPLPCWEEQAQAHAARAVDLVDAIVNSLRKSMPEAPEATPAMELSRVVTLKPVYDIAATAGGPALPSNVRLCEGVSDVSLSMQTACDQARYIFEQLFPDLDFTLQEVVEVSEEAQQMQSAAVVENDDEAAYLEFALKAAMPSPAQDAEGTLAQTKDMKRA